LYDLILVIHVIVSLLLVIVVLLQSGKSADLAGAFGGMGSQSTFGPRGTASLLSKMTTTLAILFMVTSLSLWIIQANRSGPKSVVEDIPQEQSAVPPAQTPPDTGKAPATGETGAQEQKADQPPAAATEQKTGTATEKKLPEPEKKESGQEKVPENNSAKQ
jgi:preprotein translocase subunit SecG